MTIHQPPSLFPGDALRPDWPWGNLRPWGYDLIMIDPPWKWVTYGDRVAAPKPEPEDPGPPLPVDLPIQTKPAPPEPLKPKRRIEMRPEANYRTMTLEAIAALPVRELAAPDCLLWVWGTAPLLDKQIDIMTRGWGFRYCTSGVWVKKTVNDKTSFGGGYVLRNAHEHILIGTLGEPKCARTVRSVIEGQRREHSRKPHQAYVWAERLIPEARRADLFSRQVRAGWDAWGDETGRFPEGAP